MAKIGLEEQSCLVHRSLAQKPQCPPMYNPMAWETILMIFFELTDYGMEEPLGHSPVIKNAHDATVAGGLDHGHPCGHPLVTDFHPHFHATAFEGAGHP